MGVKASVFGVGSELLLGHTLDTNTAELAADLKDHGAQVEVTYRVADEKEPLARELKHALSHSDLVVVTGGLGPTPDDVTREAVAEAVGAPLEFDPAVYQTIQAFFQKLHKPMPKINEKQAKKPAGARWLENPRGTAPGFLWQEGKKTLVVLPGPPAEWRPMWQEAKKALGLEKKARYKKVLKTFGLGESDLYRILGEALEKLGIYAKPWGVELVVEDPDLTKRIRKKLKGKIWGEDEDTLPALVRKKLAAEGKTLAVMESLTGGLLSELITSEPGVSKVYKGGMVSYTREAPFRRSRNGAPRPRPGERRDRARHGRGGTGLFGRRLRARRHRGGGSRPAGRPPRWRRLRRSGRRHGVEGARVSLPRPGS